MTNKQKLYAALKNGVVEVTFTKVNGTKRTMECTLKDDLIPVKPTTGEIRERVRDADIVNVWSVLDEAWRSFRLPNVIEWSEIEDV